MEESIETGVIYEIRNKTNGKIYIGRASSFEKHGKKKPSKYGAEGRLRRHISNANSSDPKTRNDCPALYEAIRKDGEKVWEAKTLLVCNKKDLRKEEFRITGEKKSYLPEIGYNYSVGDNKPTDGINKEKYEKNKELKNKQRAVGGKLRKKIENKGLPENIYYHKGNKLIPTDGYLVRIIINKVLYTKTFVDSNSTLEEKLEKAKAYLTEVKSKASNN